MRQFSNCPQVSPALLITYFCNQCYAWFINQNVHDPIMAQNTLVTVTCATLLMDHYVYVPWKYIHHHMRTQWPPFQNINQKRAMNLFMTFDPTYMYVKLEIIYVALPFIVSPIEICTGYVDTMSIFQKIQATRQWPLGELLPHFCWGHMYNTIPKDNCV